MKLLVVEDERMLCDTIAKSLHHAGYEVDCCYDGAEALERLLIEQYDLIVLDLHLPGMDGMEVLERLRQTDAETKVLILSAHTNACPSGRTRKTLLAYNIPFVFSCKPGYSGQSG